MDREDLKKAMKDAHEMQVGLVKIQEELAKKEVIGQSFDAKVKVFMRGQGEFTAVKIDPSLFADGAKAVEAGVLEAIRDANKQTNELAKQSLGEISKKIGL